MRDRNVASKMTAIMQGNSGIQFADDEAQMFFINPSAPASSPWS